ncbi:MAG TPA: AAA family ATPase [Spirochaetota bacterium]|nr:AAA family ATPase [Spirochaetota bacterium]
MVINENVDRKIIPVASGKGGVGKTVLAVNLALALAGGGKKTVLVDLDLGSSNLHTCLGIKNVNPGVGNLLSDSELDFKDILTETPYRGLRFVPGDVLITGLAGISHSQRKRVARQILKIDADYVIIDLGSGTSTAVLDFFLVSNSGIIMTTPQPTAVTNAFAFLKNLMFRFLQRALSSSKEVSRYIKSVNKERLPLSTPTVLQILSKMKEIDPEAAGKAALYISMMHPKLVVNFARTPNDLLAGSKLRDLTKRNLDVDLECMGLIYADKAVDSSVLERVPLLRFDPEAVSSIQIKRIAQKIVEAPNFPLMTKGAGGSSGSGGPVGSKEYADSFELAHAEAEEDFRVSSDGPPGVEASDVENLINVIAEQKRRIDELKGTVRMLTLRDM